MNLEYFNCPKPQQLDAKNFPKAEFLTYQPDFEVIKSAVVKYHTMRNIVLIGHGGSITSFIAIYAAFKDRATKNVYVLNTVDPDYIHELKQKLTKNDTLVIAISKSGETTTQIEALLQFLEYPMLFITGNGSPLYQIAERTNTYVVEHPPIGGRYTAFTEVALLPAALCGIDVESIFKAGRNYHQKYQEVNEAWNAASILWQLEQQMYVDVLLPIYSHYLFPASNLIVQLCHESFGKAGKGQTYLAHEGPELHHHTTQRFFGGRKNIASLVTTIEHSTHQEVTVVPESLSKVRLKFKSLTTLDKIPLDKAFNFESQSMMEDAKIKNIPLLHLTLHKLTEEELGKYIAFWQLYALYGSILRKVDPFNQPEVETAKKISFDKRLQFKGLL